MEADHELQANWAMAYIERLQAVLKDVADCLDHLPQDAWSEGRRLRFEIQRVLQEGGSE